MFITQINQKDYKQYCINDCLHWCIYLIGEYPSLSENEIDVEIENMESLSKKTGFKVWEPTYIPEGFKLYA